MVMHSEGLRDQSGNHRKQGPKWMIPGTIVQLFAADQMKIFLKRSIVIFGPFWPKNGHFGFENGHGSFQKYFHLIGSEKLYYGAWNHPFWPLFSMVTRVIPHCTLPFPPPFCKTKGVAIILKHILTKLNTQIDLKPNFKM